MAKKKLADKLKGVKKTKRRKEPLWRGPEIDGVTQSMLGSFLECRERFRLFVVEGLRPADEFNHRIEYGNMWHICEEAYGKGEPYSEKLFQYAKVLCSRYPLSQQQIAHWANVCDVQFPVYVDYWEFQEDKRRKYESILQEEEFSVPYELPTGRIVLLRGKWDEVLAVGKGRNRSILLQENKTKGDIKEQLVEKQLGFDLQTMFYLTALSKHKRFLQRKVKGVRYNVIRRPLSGGKGSIRQHKPTKSNPKGESSEEFYNRLGGIIRDDPQYFFMRWEVGISDTDITNFQIRFLNPILIQLCDWWDWMSKFPSNPFGSELTGVHFQTPYGIYNSLAQGGKTELDEYLASGSELGLEQTTTVFPELEG